MRQQEAKDILMREFDKWEQQQKFREKPTVGNALGFYAYIESNKPSLLNFNCAGDKWQKLKSWLYESNRIRDNR